MGLVGLVVNNLSDLIALFAALLVGFWSGKLVQKHFPNFHLSPWKWFRAKSERD